MHRFSLVACARWESENIFEWVSYHLSLGVDHIYLYCNDDSPDSLYKEISVFCRGENPSITFIHYPFVGEQWKMYMHFLENYKGSTEIACFLDIDEFLTFKKHKNLSSFFEFINKKEWDTIIFNWVMFGNNGYKSRPKGDILNNYTKRSRRMSHITKVFFKTKKVNLDYMKRNPIPFWHGIGINTYDVFNYNLVHITPQGESFPVFYEKWWELNHKDKNSLEIISMENEVINSSYVSHFFLKSNEDAKRRIKRGTDGNFSGQNSWSSKAESESELIEYMKEFNAVEDLFLKKLWEDFHKPEPDNFYIPPAVGINISENCICNQSSVSQWSGDQSSTYNDASRPVNMKANGVNKNHTEVEENAWWQIDLGKEYFVSEVRLFHRTERNVEIKKFKIEFSIDNENWEILYKTEKDFVFGGIDGRPFIINGLKLRSRYIKISLLDLGAIHFDRVEIYGYPETISIN